MRFRSLLGGARAILRIAKAIERLVAIEEERWDVEKRAMSIPTTGRAKIGEISSPSTGQLNDWYDEEHPAWYP